MAEVEKLRDVGKVCDHVGVGYHFCRSCTGPIPFTIIIPGINKVVPPYL